jgi:hypothetical protein
MTNFLRALLVLCMALVATPVLAHPGHDHKLMGTITAINGDVVTIKTTKGQERSFEITADTKILRGVDKEPLKAKSVQYAAPAAKRTGT